MSETKAKQLFTKVIGDDGSIRLWGAKFTNSTAVPNWHNISILLIDREKGEQTAHACEIAWFRKLTISP